MSTPALERAAEALVHEFGLLPEEAEGMHDDAARSAVSAALHDPDDPDWLAKELAEAHGFRGVFFDGRMPDHSAGSVSAMRDKYRRQAAALTAKILGEVA